MNPAITNLLVSLGAMQVRSPALLILVRARGATRRRLSTQPRDTLDTPALAPSGATGTALDGTWGIEQAWMRWSGRRASVGGREGRVDGRRRGPDTRRRRRRKEDPR